MKSRSQIFSLTIQIQLKMSWNDYVNNLVATGHIEKAALVGANGAIWAATAGWALKADEIKAIAASWPNFAAAGLKVAGDKFMFLRGDDQVVLAKKGATGVVIAKTKTAFVIAFHNDKQQIGNANKEVLKIADYLTEQNY
eukprot:TRINITY_DN899_c0_g1_i1.p1 TRINITY_DN899_c0_g1~~TRINITY_DN899_c0_g1_i1.p1  ORF type:complete len:140 (-),score=41.24 TRINITY_DN899_c0_g1_i1:79-498(-)